MNKAQHIVYIETLLASLCYICKYTHETVEVKICNHTQCRCEFTKMDKDIVGQLSKIIWKTKLSSKASEESRLLNLALQYLNRHDKKMSVNSIEPEEKLIENILGHL